MFENSIVIFLGFSSSKKNQASEMGQIKDILKCTIKYVNLFILYLIHFMSKHNFRLTDDFYWLFLILFRPISI